MHTLRTTSFFTRKVKKIRSQSSVVSKQLEKAFTLLQKDPHHASLRTHKVIAKRDKKSAFSSHVNKDLRILWRYDAKDIQVIGLVDVGGHSGKKKVYQ